MDFRNEMFTEYRNLMETTNLQACYQQIIKLIRYVRARLEEELDSYDFMNRVVENQMDFSYFQATNTKLKEQGLKIQVVFIHRTCCFEVWVSGYNRKIQQKYYEKISGRCPFEVCDDPEKNDYIVKIPVCRNIVAEEIENIISEMKTDIEKLENFIHKESGLW